VILDTYAKHGPTTTARIFVVFPSAYDTDVYCSLLIARTTPS